MNDISEKLEALWAMIQDQPDQQWTCGRMYAPSRDAYCALGWALHKVGVEDRDLEEMGLGSFCVEHHLGLPTEITMRLIAKNDLAYTHQEALGSIRSYIDEIKRDEDVVYPNV